MAKYGIPYQGSKGSIAEELLQQLPSADHFYDLFGGGFSVTHAAMVNRPDFKTYHYNEIIADMPKLVKAAIEGKLSYEVFAPDWVNREDFFANLDNPYIRVCWSFGNTQKTYLFSPEIEQYKKAIHMAVVFGKFDSLASEVLGFSVWPEELQEVKQRRLFLRHKIEHYRVTEIPRVLYQFLNEKQLKQMNEFTLDNLRRLQQLERLEQLQQLEQLEHGHQLYLTSKDYSNVDILPNSIVYCDIPYAGTFGYSTVFSHKDFFDWAATRDFPVYVSEYNIPDERFSEVWEKEKRGLMCGAVSGRDKAVERLYWNNVSLT